MAKSTEFVPDGDAAFLRVNSRKPVHTLMPGEAAAATNMRFDDGKPRPRFGIGVERWGRIDITGSNLAAGLTWSSFNSGVLFSAAITLQTGVTYVLLGAGSATGITLGVGPPDPAAVVYGEGEEFVYPGTVTVRIYQNPADLTQFNQTIGAELFEVAEFGNVIAYGRFNDPLGVDNGVLITDDWRDAGGEDGGRGRAYRIIPGNVPQVISLNGHDVWGPCRIVQAHHTLVLARHGNERHYFSASAVDDANDRIQLNCTPGWSDGDIVFFFAEANSQLLAGPNTNAPYYVHTDGSNRVTLHPTAADAIADTNKITMGAATGKFYLERRADTPGPLGNGAPPLILQPTATLTAFENGFRSAPTKVTVTDSDAALDTVTAPSHRLLAGDSITIVLSTDGTLAKFARPLSDHVIKLYDTQANALAGTGTGLFNVTVDDQTGTVVKTGAAALPMPPLRELVYHKGRIIGIVSGTKDQIVISDPFDFLHYSIFNGLVPANLGESGNANWLLPLGDDALLIGKDLCVLVITGLSGASSGWAMDEVTREFGGIAALAAVNVGKDGWFANRKGMASVARTVAGEKLAEATPVSADIPDDLIDINWAAAGVMCAETWNNRLFWAVPIKGQVGTAYNNRVLVYSFTNQRLRVEQTTFEGQIVGSVVNAGQLIDSWEGRWEGEHLKPIAFARLKINGEERLTFATPSGFVAWFTDGFEDVNGAIETSLNTRGYFGGARVLALSGEINWDTYNPKLSVTAKTLGVNEETALVEDLQFDRTQYLVNGQADYDPDTSTEEDFERAHREDYSMVPEELLVGRLDVHQNQTENLRMRLRDRAPQLVISNTQGSVRINSVQIAAKPVGLRATRQT